VLGFFMKAVGVRQIELKVLDIPNHRDFLSRFRLCFRRCLSFCNYGSPVTNRGAWGLTRPAAASPSIATGGDQGRFGTNVKN
jgi:hypothetical protein